MVAIEIIIGRIPILTAALLIAASGWSISLSASPFLLAESEKVSPSREAGSPAKEERSVQEKPHEASMKEESPSGKSQKGVERKREDSRDRPMPEVSQEKKGKPAQGNVAEPEKKAPWNELLDRETKEKEPAPEKKKEVVHAQKKPPVPDPPLFTLYGSFGLAIPLGDYASLYPLGTGAHVTAIVEKWSWKRIYPVVRYSYARLITMGHPTITASFFDIHELYAEGRFRYSLYLPAIDRVLRLHGGISAGPALLYMKRDSDGTELVTFTGAVGATVGASIDVWKNITVMFSVEYRAVFSTPVVHMLSILFSAGVRV